MLGMGMRVGSLAAPLGASTCWSLAAAGQEVRETRCCRSRCCPLATLSPCPKPQRGDFWLWCPVRAAMLCRGARVASLAPARCHTTFCHQCGGGWMSLGLCSGSPRLNVTAGVGGGLRGVYRDATGGVPCEHGVPGVPGCCWESAPPKGPPGFGATRADLGRGRFVPLECISSRCLISMVTLSPFWGAALSLW